MPSTLSKPLGVRVPHAQLAQLEEIAEERKATRGAIATEALCRGLELIAAELAERAPARSSARARRKSSSHAQPAAAQAVESAGDLQSLRGIYKGQGMTDRLEEGRARERGAQLEAGSDLAAFSAEVLESARRCKTGRSGEDRIFVSHVWRQYKRTHRPRGLNLEGFKERLLEANRERTLSLVCADMAPFLDQKDVQESEIRYLSATFHFLCI